ncbi:hypothetical protein [Natrinema salaciae]|uniref:DUF8053 domain-containing protein n=1 Tax=Natrinema salaciae TaxID=1186196 RepID=A0A1H9RRI0_9EURY|nr:hypothetical protein [Natrinema salaciae]SER75184.1 hypothetical protein SAMN04489841_4507 [Natrinema salaciae]
MAIRKLQEVGGGSTGVTIPKDDLVLEEILDKDGQLDGDYHAHVNYEGEGEWTLKLIEFDTDE